DAAETFADGGLDRATLLAARKDANLAVWELGGLGFLPHLARAWANSAAALTTYITIDVAFSTAPVRAAIGAALAAGEEHARGPRRAEEEARQADLLRDVFGNPFRRLRLDPAWSSPVAVGLAQAMYGSRDFSALPVMADALEEAGCADAEL